MHVPMIINCLLSHSGRTTEVEQIASLMDIMPTLIDLCGLGYAESAGISLTPGMMGMPKSNHVIWCWRHYPLTFQWSPCCPAQ